MRPVLGQFLRFAVVGVANTAIYYVVYLPLRLLVGYVAAHVVAWFVSTAASFVLNCRFTYKVPTTVRRAVLYPFSNVPNLLATTVGVVALVELAGMSAKLAPLVAGILAIPLTFLVQRTLMVGRWSGDPVVSTAPGPTIPPGSPTDVDAEPPTR
ncbi:GtrA family protein [Phycicoccus sp.]|uniref:GtrA family protein n=1 Tax=Phycicoccus sp. TaxID=1902410 RepID=UPI002BC623AA|nr:GtrA family protein [Phycicoccus sp.]HMM93714.1 GtrA family protein [Phycicoccus sp.]